MLYTSLSRAFVRVVLPARRTHPRNDAVPAGAAPWPQCGTAARRLGSESGPSGAPSARGACAVRWSSMAAGWWRVPGRPGSREASGEARAPLRRVKGCVVAARGWWDGQLRAARCGRLQETSRVRAAPGPEAGGDGREGGKEVGTPPPQQCSPGPAQPPPAPGCPLKPVPEPPAPLKARGAGGTLGLERASASLTAVAAASLCVAGAVLRTRLSVHARGMPLAVPAPRLCGLRVPGLAVLAAWG